MICDDPQRDHAMQDVHIKNMLSVMVRPCREIGKSTFLSSLDEALGTLVAHDMRWTIVYSAVSAPQVMAHSLPVDNSVGVDDGLIRRTYDAGYFRFDPFYRYWREQRQGGVLRLSDIARPNKEDATYMFGFVPLTGFEDDVALMCPVDEDHALALTVESVAGFSDYDMERLEAFYALMAAMIESHWRLSGQDAELSAREVAAQPPLNFSEAVKSFLPGLLTPREREITFLSLAGFNNEAIAKKMDVSTGTIKNHKKRLYAKVDVTSERELFSLFLGFLAEVDPSELHLGYSQAKRI
ncbi:helix-turn-helix transcriptional regulator [Pelagimonas sp. KU-00592-HH]|uniref:helix-turn-helix transcriptional regulator n=1 Tax=Pelagimonas sp. KU-00592-HH TaxID=3127651 RepID=UPI0033421242